MFQETTNTVRTAEMSLHFEGFQEAIDEKKARDTMQLKLLSYNLQKHVAHCHPEMESEKGVVGDVRVFG